MSKELGEIRKKLDAYLKGNLSNEQVDELWVEFAKQPELLNDLEIEVGIRDIIKNEGVRKDNNNETFEIFFYLVCLCSSNSIPSFWNPIFSSS